MDLGLIGLERIGTNRVRRLLRAGHQCVVYDIHPEAVQAIVKEKAIGATPLTTALYERLSSRGGADFPDRLLSAPRFQSGGHRENPARQEIVMDAAHSDAGTSDPQSGRRHVAVTGPYQGWCCMTLTCPILNRAYQMPWRATGANQASRLADRAPAGLPEPH